MSDPFSTVVSLPHRKRMLEHLKQQEAEAAKASDAEALRCEIVGMILGEVFRRHGKASSNDLPLARTIVKRLDARGAINWKA